MQTLRESLQPALERIEHNLANKTNGSVSHVVALNKVSDFKYDPHVSLDELQEQLKDALRKVLEESFPDVSFPEKIITVRSTPIADITIRYSGR